MDGLTDTSQGLPSVAWGVWITWVALGYLAGSIPFGLLIGGHDRDVRMIVGHLKARESAVGDAGAASVRWRT